MAAGKIVVVLSAFLASAGDALAQMPFTERDSAGIRIVRSELDGATLRERSVDSAPLLSVGELAGDADYLLHRVRHVRRLEDGSLRLVQAGREIRYYDEDGRYVKTIGRPGDGPGAFRAISAVRELDDGRLLLADGGSARFTEMSAEGSVLATHRLDSLNAVGFTVSGSLVATTGGSWGLDSQGREGLAETLVRAQLRTESEIVFLGEFPGPTFWASPSGQGFVVRILPWSPSTEFAVDGDRIAVGWSGAPRVSMYDESGCLVQIVEWDAEATPLDPTYLEARAEGDPVALDELRNLPLPENRPFFERLLVDAGGGLWVGQARATDGIREWTVFNRGGIAGARIRTPARFRVESAEEDACRRDVAG